MLSLTWELQIGALGRALSRLPGRETRAFRNFQRHSSNPLSRRNSSCAVCAAGGHEEPSGALTALRQPWSWPDGLTLPRSPSAERIGRKSTLVCVSWAYRVVNAGGKWALDK